ncbi:RNA polymerase sigma factor [Zhouia sp. PK063]|uniref:RNA polymerase sigma factor n=1 Tax=Zhouia sp. PK063 TaxID=3373602 RepID=UPI0037BC80E9
MSNYKNNFYLITSLKEGDDKAFAFVIDTYFQQLCIYANGYIKDHQAAQDLVQEVLFKLWTKRETLIPTHKLKNFLYKSVYHEFIDQYRKNQSLSTLEKRYTAAVEILVEKEDSDFDHLIKIVRKEIEKLPPRCKQTFMLSKNEGLSNKEIAAYLNISVKTVEAHITTAFSILREKLHDKVEYFYVLQFGNI